MKESELQSVESFQFLISYENNEHLSQITQRAKFGFIIGYSGQMWCIQLIINNQFWFLCTVALISH